MNKNLYATFIHLGSSYHCSGGTLMKTCLSLTTLVLSPSPRTRSLSSLLQQCVPRTVDMGRWGGRGGAEAELLYWQDNYSKVNLLSGLNTPDRVDMQRRVRRDFSFLLILSTSMFCSKINSRNQNSFHDRHKNFARWLKWQESNNIAWLSSFTPHYR